MVKCAAVCTGSGKSMIKDVIKAGADVYVTVISTTIQELIRLRRDWR